MKDLRREYKKDSLLESDINPNPIEQFKLWFNTAQNSELILEANAMILTTVDGDSPDARTVLLKGVENDNFQFFTNYNGKKGKQLSKNPNCTLVFLWLGLERQVIIKGKAERLSSEESDDYFASRPRGSQIGAWASNQSSEVASREELDKLLEAATFLFEGKEVERPSHWGGYQIIPSEIEFWQGRNNRMHDRLVYLKNADEWTIKRLQP